MKRTFDLCVCVRVHEFSYKQRYLNDDGEREEGYKASFIEVWGGFSSLFCWISLLSLQNQKDQILPTASLATLFGFVFFPYIKSSYCRFIQSQFQVHVLIISCILLDHGSEVNLNGGRARHKDGLHAITTTSNSCNIVSVAAIHVSQLDVKSHSNTMNSYE